MEKAYVKRNYGRSSYECKWQVKRKRVSGEHSYDETIYETDSLDEAIFMAEKINRTDVEIKP